MSEINMLNIILKYVQNKQITKTSLNKTCSMILPKCEAFFF